uniref:Alpha/beta fold hydrolase n=1 Tax=Ignisphaera aggregans TaxID=334771 RepID=A0A7C4BCQ3_9CREN
MLCEEVFDRFESDGYKLPYVFHKPKTEGFPVIVMLHGFTGNKVEANRLYVDIARALCSAGIAAFRFDFRCHGDAPLHFEEFELGMALRDAENAINYVKSFKPGKIGLLGLSMGGHIAAKLAAQQNDINLLILLSPAIEFREAPSRALQIPFDGEFYYFGAFRIRKSGLESFWRSSALELANKIATPTLIVHAKDDNVVSYKQSEEFYVKLASKDKKFVLLDTGGHVFSDYKVKEHVISEIVKWASQFMIL